MAAYQNVESKVSIIEKKQNKRLVDKAVRGGIRCLGIAVVGLMILITLFLAYRGIQLFTRYHHSLGEFLFSSDWAPNDSMEGGGKVGSAVYFVGSILTCGIALLIAAPFSITVSVFISELVPDKTKAFFQMLVEILAGVPSIIYGWMGLTILVPWLKEISGRPHGFSVMAGALVLALMVLPTMITLCKDSYRSVPEAQRLAAYGLGATKFQMIKDVILPTAKTGVFTAFVLGLSRAFGEALAVAMVIGKTRAFPADLLSPTTNLTSAIASDMGGAMEGGEYNAALWAMALSLFVISLVFVFIIGKIGSRGRVND